MILAEWDAVGGGVGGPRDLHCARAGNGVGLVGVLVAFFWVTAGLALFGCRQALLGAADDGA